MPARPLEGHAISPAPYEGVRQAHSVPVDRHKAIDGAFQRVIENRLDAAQVAKSLLTDVSHEGDRPRRLNVRLIQDAGIDVLTTMNVQHIESLNDQVWQVTGIRVRETIPDWVVEEADEIVMIDLSPRALLHRLERGVVYAPDKALRALENFFTETNLTALRELALRQAAHQVEDHRTAARPAGSAEKILIHLTADPSTAMLIRRGGRVADYLQTECLAVYVAKDPQWTDVTPEERSAIEKHLGFARSLRIETTILTGRDTAKAIADFARDRNVTQLFIGRNSKDARRIVDNARDLVVTVAAARRR